MLALPFFRLSSPSKAAIYLKFLTISVEYFEGGGETNSLQNAMQQEDDDRRSRRHPQSSVSKGECGSKGGERKRMFFGENSVRAKGLWAGLTKSLRTSQERI